MLRVALPRLFCERLLVETFGRDDWLFTVVLRGLLARCVERVLLRAGVARCVRVDDRLLWLTEGLVARGVLDVDRFWRAGVVARLPVLRVVPVFGAVARVRVAGLVASRVRVAGLAASRLRLALFERVASVFRPLAGRALRLSVVLVVAPRVVVFRSVVRVVVALPFVERLAVRTAAASVTRAGRAADRLLRSTSGR